MLLKKLCLQIMCIGAHSLLRLKIAECNVDMLATIVLLTSEEVAMIVAAIVGVEVTGAVVATANTAAQEVAAAREAAPVMAAEEAAKSATRRAVQDHVQDLAPENHPDPAGDSRDHVHGKSHAHALIRNTLARNQSLALDLTHVRHPSPARRSRSARSLATRRRSARRSSLSLAASHAAALDPSHATRRESAATLAEAITASEGD
jgi:hypothetical protein